MTRAGFGQQSDLSGLFTSFYEADIANRERLARDLEQRNKERDAAKDAEMFSKYQHGDITGAQLLNYIQSRIADSKGDPTELAKWQNAYRDYEQAINDQNAEDAFANGGSIHALISYYRDRKAEVKQGTPAYSEITQRLNQLIDQSAGEDLYAGEQRILDNIQAGKASYSDLVKFYQRQLSSLRPGSTLHDDVQTRLDNAQDTVAQQRVESNIAQIDYQYKSGQITAEEANRQMIAAAQIFQQSDPSRYWSLLEQGQGYILDQQANGIPNPGALAPWGGTTPPATTPSYNGIVGTPPKSTAPSSAAEALISAAASLLHTPYKLGAESRRATDCSGLIYQAFMGANLGDLIGGDRKLAAGYQRYFAKEGQFTRNIADVRRGDLVMYGNGQHIGIYLGRGKVMSALTTTGVTVHNLNGISEPVTGFLIVDWSRSNNTPSMTPPRKPSQPSQPSSGRHNRPEVQEKPQTATEPLPPQVVTENDPGPSRTDATGKAIPYSLTLPKTPDEAREQIQTIAAYQKRALEMADAKDRGDKTYSDGTPLTDETVHEALNAAYEAAQYQHDVALALNDPSAAIDSQANQSQLAGAMLKIGDTREGKFLTTMLSNVDKSFSYSQKWDMDPNHSLLVANAAATILTNYSNGLVVGDPLSGKGVSQDYKDNVDALATALRMASNPDSDPTARDAAIAALPPDLRPIVTGVTNVATAAKGVNDGSMVITVVGDPNDPVHPPEYVAVPSRDDVLPNGQIVKVPDNGLSRSEMVPIVIQRNGMPETIWVPPTNQPLKNGKVLQQMVISENADLNALKTVLPGLFTVTYKGNTLDPTSTGADRSGAVWSAPAPGTVVTSDFLDNANPADLARLVNSGSIKEVAIPFRSVTVPAFDPDGPTRSVITDPLEGGQRRYAAVDTQPITPSTVWYQDPETLRWTEGTLPVDNIEPDGYGGVRTERTASGDIVYHLKWAPGAGVPVISVASPKATQDAYNSGQLDGYLPPPIYRDKNGDATTDPTIGIVPDPSTVYDRSPGKIMSSPSYRDFRLEEQGPAVYASGNANVPASQFSRPSTGEPSVPGVNKMTNLLGDIFPLRSTLDNFLGNMSTTTYQNFRAGEQGPPTPAPIPAATRAKPAPTPAPAPAPTIKLATATARRAPTLPATKAYTPPPAKSLTGGKQIVLVPTADNPIYH